MDRVNGYSFLGGGFAGLTVAMELEKKLARDPSVEVRLVNRKTWMTHSVPGMCMCWKEN